MNSLDNQILCPRTTQLVNYIWLQFYFFCLNFDKEYADDHKLNACKTMWTKNFMRLGIKNPKQIELGIRNIELNKPFTPSIEEFLSWCKPESKKHPDEHQAYLIAYEIMRGEYRQDLTDDQITIIKHTIKQSDSFFLQQQSMSATKPVFCRNYEISKRYFDEGKLKPIPKAIENKSNPQDDDPWKTMKKYGYLPQYAHLNSRDKAMPVINEILKKIENKLPYDKNEKLS